MPRNSGQTSTARQEPEKPETGHLRLNVVLERELRNAAAHRSASLSILDELLAHGFSRAEISDLVVPSRTLARRRNMGDRLSPEESDRAVRVARITALAERVFGEPAKAHRWLRKSSPMLAAESPLALLRTETGAHLVEQALHRIDYGMFA
jgi:putative toxin-antitoxin system antitoxin component (TIGR02293 family)